MVEVELVVADTKLGGPSKDRLAPFPSLIVSLIVKLFKVTLPLFSIPVSYTHLTLPTIA